jgi:mRNA interferase HigB
MKIHLIRKETIEEYAVSNARSRPSFEEWLSKLNVADWNIPTDIKSTFGSADLLGNRLNRVVFNIGGNNYRMICKYGFGKKQVHLFICWIGTHTEYDLLCNQNNQFTVSNF